MNFGLVHSSYSLLEWQAVRLTFFAPELSNTSNIPRKKLSYNLGQNARNTSENFVPFHFPPPLLCNAVVPCTFVIASHHCRRKGKCMGVSRAFSED